MENKITFEDIQRVNKTIKTTDIKGKDYAEVNQRIKAYRMLYPTGTILTEMLSNENGICIFKASIYDEDTNIIATGTAYEKEDSTFINKTSYIENCETSAVGRALGMAGFGIDTSIASAEEVLNAIENQKSDDKATKEQIKLIQKILNEEQIVSACELVKREKLEDFTKQEADSLIKNISSKK